MKIFDFRRCCWCHEKIESGGGDKCGGGGDGINRGPGLSDCTNYLCSDCSNEHWRMCPRHELLDSLDSSSTTIDGGIADREEYERLFEEQMPERDELIAEAKEMEKEDEREYYEDQEQQSDEHKSRDKHLTDQLERANRERDMMEARERFTDDDWEDDDWDDDEEDF